MNIYDIEAWQTAGYVILSVGFIIAMVWLVTRPFR